MGTQGKGGCTLGSTSLPQRVKVIQRAEVKHQRGLSASLGQTAKCGVCSPTLKPSTAKWGVCSPTLKPCCKTRAGTVFWLHGQPGFFYGFFFLYLLNSSDPHWAQQHGSGGPQVFRTSKVKCLESRSFEGLSCKDGKRAKVSLGSGGNSQKERGTFSRSHRRRTKAPENKETKQQGSRRGEHTVWARGGKAELDLTSLKALSSCGENRARRKAEGTPEEALQHPGERGLDQEGCQKLRMGVYFGTMADPPDC